MILGTTRKSSAKLSRREIMTRSAKYAAGMAALVAGSRDAGAQTLQADYVVVGSGPGGGPLACNLARAGYKVILLEAGTPATEPDLETLIEVPVFNSFVTADPRVAWDFYVRHYANTAQQQKDSKYVAAKDGILYPRASTIGGCGIHNVLVMMYPSNSDWENIAGLTGDDSWSPDSMRNYFQRMEQCRYATPPAAGSPDTARHGFNGWQTTELPDPQIFLADPEIHAILQVAQDRMGTPTSLADYAARKLDPNDYSTTVANKEGLYGLPLSRLNGARLSIRDHILQTAAAHPNLQVMTNCLVTRVLMDGDMAKGVEYMQGTNLYSASPLSTPGSPSPATKMIKVSREVIVSAGSFNSPQILKLSGIGDPDELEKLGIKVTVRLPGVGTGMMDRYEMGVVTQLKAANTLFNNCQLGSPTDPCFGQFLQGTGPYTTNLTAITSIRRSTASSPDRDLLILLATGPFHGYFPGWEQLVVNPTQFSWLVLKAHTANQAGTVKLQSANPRDMPLINFHYFGEGTDTAGSDLNGVVSGIKTIRDLNAQLSSIASAELVPGPAVQSDNDIKTFVQNEAWGHHASCSNHMGRTNDPLAVVDGDFKVIGTRNLRVVDASVFPKIPGFYPMIPIMMISEKASDVILDEARNGGPKKR